MCRLVIVVTELGEMLVDGNELFEVRTLLNGGNQCQLLKVLLQDLLSFINQAVTTWYGLFLDTPDHLFCEVDRRLGEFDVGILVYQLLMKEAEGFVLLAHDPLFLVELDLNHILCILSVVNGIIVHSG